MKVKKSLLVWILANFVEFCAKKAILIRRCLCILWKIMVEFVYAYRCFEQYTRKNGLK